MDYEKEYNEALERAQRILCNLPEGSTTIRDIEAIFPELAGSEDERIRETLVKYFKRFNQEDMWNDEVSIKDIVVYLEKQKEEQKPAEWSDTNELVFKDICKHLKEEGYNGWVVLLNALRNGEFQLKQEWSEEDSEIRTNRIYLKGYNDAVRNLKPSEEQMEALKHYVDTTTDGEIDLLYNDLKKLM